MPVRIYDIAKRVGVESKVVLAKAKELGIVNARVPSSTLDKITAEYLEEQMGFKPGAPAPKEEPAPPAPVLVPAPETAPPAVPPPGAPARPEVAPSAAPVPAPPIIELLTTAVPVAAGLELAAATPSSTIAPPAASAGIAETVPDVVTIAAVSEASAPVPSPAVRVEVSGPAPAPPVVVEAPAPPAPPPPPAPKVGDKIGFIQLPVRPRPADRPGAKGPARAPAGKAEPPRGREGKSPAGPAKTPMGAAQRGLVTGGIPGKDAGRGVGLPPVPQATGEEIILRPPISVRDLAEALKRKPFQLIADLMELGVFATVNQPIEPEVAQRVCAKYNFRFRVEKRVTGSGVHRQEIRRSPEDDQDKPEQLKPRAPVVTIMGHVDHGKTTLLDVIRKSNVAAGEAGGITQHIGAYTVEIPRPDRPQQAAQITFLDTPGHAAFSSMRARGANVTDIVVLVVAANDGVMPQTIEAISHAQAAHVPILVAVNKCDHPNASPMRVRQQLQEHGLVPDDWGGDTLFVDVSALTKQGIDKLLEAVLLQAELLDLRANPERLAWGNIIESGLEPGGPTATVLVRKGTLSVSDVIMCGHYYGKVRALINEENKRLKRAGPSVAVRVLGLNGVPEAGVEFTAVLSDRVARELCEQQTESSRGLEREARPKMTIIDFMDRLDKESAKVLKVVVKADMQGSLEAIADALKKTDTDKVSLEIIHGAVGTIAESDVLLASASQAVILGFHTRIDAAASELARREGVEIRLYAIIYELIDQVRDAMTGLLDPLLKEVVFGAAEVRKVFSLSKGGNVAGCVVASGRLVKGKARVMRRKNLVFEGIIQTIRRFQDEVTEVRAGMECGIRIDGFDAFAEGDVVECYTTEKVPQKL